jgi:DNA polymerase I-like protein with 3'-5' exonuclease and polymerase domains
LDALGIRIPTKDGRETVDELHLLRLIDNPRTTPEARKFLQDLLDYRGAAKMLSTYANVEKDFDDKVRFSITVPGTVEGRFSSKQTAWETGLNSQNVPKEFRKIIVPHHKDWKIVSMDFKQADPHMVAWLSGEDKMLSILNDPKGDLHAHTASGIVGYDITTVEGYDKSTSRERKLGKACNNGLNYGMQPIRFAETCRKQGLIITAAEAQAAYMGYFSLYPGIRAWQESIRFCINRTRTLCTPFGRKRYFYGFINDKLYNNAFAYIAPTTVADALNAGWLLIERERKGLAFEVLAQVHDSLVLQCPSSEVEVLVALMKKCYNEVRFDVGKYKDCCLPTDFEVGDSWGTLKGYVGPT